jgi:hypothetical protein
VICVHRSPGSSLAGWPVRHLAAAGLAVSLAAGLLGAMPAAQAQTVTRAGQLSITPGWTMATFDRDDLILPFTYTAPCATTDYGSGIVTTYCDSVNVELLHPSTPQAVDSTMGLTKDDGTGADSLSIYGFSLRGFGAHMLRITDTVTGESTTTPVILKALTRAAGTFSRSRKAPASATLAVSGTLTVFTGWGFTTPPGTYQLVLQRQVSGRWVTARSATTSNGSANLNAKVSAKAVYRVCHLADAQSTASCTSARTL